MRTRPKLWRERRRQSSDRGKTGVTIRPSLELDGAHDGAAVCREVRRDNADAITLDLEDGVPQAHKGEVRSSLKEAIALAGAAASRSLSASTNPFWRLISRPPHGRA